MFSGLLFLLSPILTLYFTSTYSLPVTRGTGEDSNSVVLFREELLTGVKDVF
jgi:hypothetical protein